MMVHGDWMRSRFYMPPRSMRKSRRRLRNWSWWLVRSETFHPALLRL